MTRSEYRKNLEKRIGAMPTESPRERALLVGVDATDNRASWSLEDSLDELAELADTAGAEVVGRITQRLEKPSPSHYIGKGKLEEIIALKSELEYNLVIFDDELSPSQQRNLEKGIGVKILDRTALILDIFARRAQTHEGRLQVELAQHEYLLPRLTGQWSHLERLGAGIGTRGPGETQLETDRRQIRQKISHLKQEIEAVRRHRALYRQRRERRAIPVVSLVGYTNAGKSSLLNALTNANVLAENKLFATLDPTTRKVNLPNGQEILVSDTVGFIQKLPTMLVAAFRATLEELREADVLIHLVDITHQNATEQTETVHRILEDLEVGDKPAITALNKVDKFVDSEDFQGGVTLEELDVGLANEHPDAVLISATKGWGLNDLLKKVQTALERTMIDIMVLVPYGATDMISVFREQGSVLEEKYTEKGTFIHGRVPPRLAERFMPYRVSSPGAASTDSREVL